MQLS
jgi:hypothetical protein